MWKKSITPTVLVSLLWLSVGGATAYYMSWVYRSHARDMAENFSTIRAADAMQEVLWKLQSTLIDVAGDADRHTQIEIADFENAFNDYLARADANTSATPEAKDLVASIGEQFRGYQRDLHRCLDRRKDKESAAVVPTSLLQSAHNIANACNLLQDVEEKLVENSIADRSDLRSTLDWVLLVLWILGPALGILWGLWVARWLRRSISQISISLKDAASGLEHEVDRFQLSPSDDLPLLHEQVQIVSSRIKQVVDELHQARRETMLAERLAAVGEMAAGVAHELRNPLTSVKLLIQTAADGHGEKTLTEEHIHVVLEQITRMENTIQELLDFARPPQMQQVRHDVRDTLQRALNLVEGYAKQQSVVVHQDLSLTPVIVDADPEQLHQVFVNLAMNGVEAMPNGGELDLELRRIDGASPICRVLFRDTGCGIPDPIMKRIFEPFVTDKQRGTGLGLAVSRRIIEQHGGRLTAANAADCGAVFSVDLPVCEGRSDRSANAVRQRSEAREA
jgi:two-component system, NtrC family, sensor histidine kinase HydH